MAIGTDEAAANEEYLSVEQIAIKYGVSSTNVKKFLQEHQEQAIRRRTGKRGKPAYLIRQSILETLLKNR